jgi:hypothetical protein
MQDVVQFFFSSCTKAGLILMFVLFDEKINLIISSQPVVESLLSAFGPSGSNFLLFIHNYIQTLRLLESHM